MRKTIQQINEKKAKGEKITMLTAYDYPLAALIDQCGIDMILVGDSLANVVLGLPSTKDVDMEDMLRHTKAVDRAVKDAMLVGDMPYSAYQGDTQGAVANAERFIREAGCQAVKIEWFENCLDVAGRIIQAGIPLMGHVGLTPQTADKLGGFKVQGKDAATAKRIIEQAKSLEKVGCFSIVLECIPDKVAAKISQELKIPTIGIGAGADCDGQVLVTHDLLGLVTGFHPKFAKRYGDLSRVIKEAVSAYRDEVVNGRFPDKDHSFIITDEEFKKL